jgi:hypothetical protein
MTTTKDWDMNRFNFCFNYVVIYTQPHTVFLDITAAIITSVFN